MKIGYKGTDAEMKCRDTQYEIGKTYMIINKELKECVLPKLAPPENDNNLRLCSEEAIHYCNSLEEAFKWYGSNRSDRFFEVEILGRYNDDTYDKKSGTDIMRFIREVSQEEIDKSKDNLRRTERDKKMGIPDLIRIVEANPTVIVGGSTALYLRGAWLDRWLMGLNDFDLILPYYTKLFEGIQEEDYNQEDEDTDYVGTCDFNTRAFINGRKVDIVIEPRQRYDVITYNDQKFKVARLEDIIAYKAKYAQSGNKKHQDDLVKLILGGIES